MSRTRKLQGRERRGNTRRAPGGSTRNSPGGNATRPHEPDGPIGRPRPQTASQKTLESGGVAKGGAYNPHGKQMPTKGQPVLPGQTGYINQRRPVLRPSANFAPKESAYDSAVSRGKGDPPPQSIPTHRPYVQHMLDRLHAVREQQRSRLFGPMPSQRASGGEDSGGTQPGYQGQAGAPPGSRNPPSDYGGSGGSPPSEQDRPPGGPGRSGGNERRPYDRLASGNAKRK